MAEFRSNSFTGIDYIFINAKGNAEPVKDKKKDSTPKKIAQFLKKYKFEQDGEILKKITLQERAWQVMDAEELKKLPTSINPFKLNIEKIKATFKFIFQFISNGFRTNHSIINENIIKSQILRLEFLLKKSDPEKNLLEAESLIDELNESRGAQAAHYYDDLRILFAEHRLKQLKDEFETQTHDVHSYVALFNKMQQLQEKAISGICLVYEVGSTDHKINELNLSVKAFRVDLQKASAECFTSEFIRLQEAIKDIASQDHTSIERLKEETRGMYQLTRKMSFENPELNQAIRNTMQAIKELRNSTSS